MTRTSRLQAVILDWSGTTVDFGCIALAKVFVEVFRQQGLEVSLDEARGPMGTFKRDHLRTMTALPRLHNLWQEVHGRAATEADIDAMYQAYTPLQLAIIADHAELIPGALGAIGAFRARGLKVRSSTGYTQEMMVPLLPVVAAQGYTPDALFCPDDVGPGRPEPWMCFANLRALGVYPPATAVKIGDTVADVHEGLNAGMWTIALAKTGNEVGLSLVDWEALPEPEQSERLQRAQKRLQDAGAHYVVDGLADTVALLDTIESRLQESERP